ncbi:MAG: hypothetical protein RIB86_07755 [Imperialibacter sp.]
MNATIYSRSTIIGTADLQVGDESMGCVFGHFIPNDNYFKDIQKFVWEFWTTSNPDYEAWCGLRLNARLDNGYFLFPSGGYTIEDVQDLPDEPKRIDLAGVNLDILEYSTDKLLVPWSVISIEQKTSFEDELKREITPSRSLFDFLSPKKNHALVGADFSALAKCEPNDDVLFEVAKDGEANRLAVIHLTWTDDKGGPSNYFPATDFYLDFDDFAERRMKPDHLQWDA